MRSLHIDILERTLSGVLPQASQDMWFSTLSPYTLVDSIPREFVRRTFVGRLEREGNIRLSGERQGALSLFRRENAPINNPDYNPALAPQINIANYETDNRLLTFLGIPPPASSTQPTPSENSLTNELAENLSRILRLNNASLCVRGKISYTSRERRSVLSTSSSSENCTNELSEKFPFRLKGSSFNLNPSSSPVSETFFIKKDNNNLNINSLVFEVGLSNENLYKIITLNSVEDGADLCLTSDSTDQVSLKKCDDKLSEKQNWDIYKTESNDNKFEAKITQKNKCLVFKNSTLTIQNECSAKDIQFQTLTFNEISRPKQSLVPIYIHSILLKGEEKKSFNKV